MHTDRRPIRALWTLFEPIHAISYFSSEAREEFAGHGLSRYWDGYFAGRAAPLGAVTAAPVIAIFSGFAPMMVTRALPALWATVSPTEALEARSVGAATALRGFVPDEAIVGRAAALLGPISRAVGTIGRPLAAANAALPAESDPYRELWQAATTLREHRGDGHVLALTGEGIAGITTLVLRAAVDLDATAVKKGRGWTDDEWAESVNSLVERGLLSADLSISESGSAAIERAEQLTDRLAAEAWAGLSPEELLDVARAISPVARACAALFTFPNPIGMPSPWHPESDPTGESIAEMRGIPRSSAKGSGS